MHNKAQKQVRCLAGRGTSEPEVLYRFLPVRSPLTLVSWPTGPSVYGLLSHSQFIRSEHTIVVGSN
jgi:hypothetical protein